jgi:arylsulfatase A-like enzyme
MSPFSKQQSRPLFPILALLLALAMLARGAEPKPNILFILADDLGWADTTPYGKTKFHKTPNLDRLAKRGMLFTRAYSASPLCSPTRSSILTGLHPARTGLTTPNCHVAQVVLKTTLGVKAAPGEKAIDPVPVTRLNTTYTTLAETLKAAGYATGHFGKWHLGPEPYSPLEQGFDVDIPHHPGPGPAGSFVAPWKFKDFDADPAVPGQHIEDRMAKEATAFLEKHKDRPFFLNYWMFSVHAPFDAKKALIEKYAKTADPAEPQHCPTYAAMVESMDDAIGTLLDTLDRLKLADRTIIVFTSDNGGNMYSDVDGVVPTSNAPLRGGKATVYEGGIRVPFIASVPGATAPGTRSDALIQSTDLFPTFLELLGLPRPADVPFDGKSIVPALRGQPFERGPIFTYFPHSPPVPDWLPPSIVVHDGDWKLIRLFHQGENSAHRWNLFNLREDIGEQNDLAAKEPERVKTMDAQIAKFLTDTNAIVPIPNPSFDPAKYRPDEEGKGKMRVKPKAAPAPAAAAPEKVDGALQGWKARACTAKVKDGIMMIKAEGDAPFLGFAPGPLAAGVTLKARIKSNGTSGKVAWLPSAGTPPAEVPKPAEFSVKACEWTEITAPVHAVPDKQGILRLFLPGDDIAVDWIELTSGGKSRRWEF